MFSQDSIAFKCVKVCVYMAALFAYTQLGGDMRWIVGGCMVLICVTILNQSRGAHECHGPLSDQSGTDDD